MLYFLEGHNSMTEFHMTQTNDFSYLTFFFMFESFLALVFPQVALYERDHQLLHLNHGLRGIEKKNSHLIISLNWHWWELNLIALSILKIFLHPNLPLKHFQILR